MTKTFKGLIVPNDVYFYDFVDEFLAGNDRSECGCLTNAGLDIDPWYGVRPENKNCIGIACCECVFWSQNAKTRLEYWRARKGE